MHLESQNLKIMNSAKIHSAVTTSFHYRAPPPVTVPADVASAARLRFRPCSPTVHAQASIAPRGSASPMLLATSDKMKNGITLDQFKDS